MTKLAVPPALRLVQEAISIQSQDSQSITIPGLKLGQATNILLGFRPDWVASDENTSPFFSADTEPLTVFPAIIDPNPAAQWSLPRITLHEDTESLLSAIFPYGVQPLVGDASAFAVPSGPLFVRDIDRVETIKKLSAYVGFDLQAGYKYMLVEMVRESGTASRSYTAGTGGNPAEHLTAAAQALVRGLEGVNPSGPAPSLVAGSAAKFVNSFQTIGTHYVSAITAGDRIFQVFGYKDDPFNELKAAFLKTSQGRGYVEGLNALPFQYYTTPFSDRTGVSLGYVSVLGTLRIVSADPKFARSLENNEWQDSVRAGGNSIFEAAKTGSKVDLSAFASIVPIRFQLTPVGNLITTENSHAGRNYWNRLFKGAMLAKYASGVRVTFPETVDRGVRNIIPNFGPWLSTIATPTVNAYDGHLVLGAIQLTNRAAVKTFGSWSVVLEGTEGTASIPGREVSISSFLILTAGPDTPPAIELADLATLKKVAITCGSMDGALTIAHSAGPECKILMDGILLELSGAVAPTRRTTVKVTGDAFGKPSIDRLEKNLDNLNFALVTCQTLLYSHGANAEAAQQLARECLLWLANLVPADDAISQNAAVFQLRTTYLARVAQNLNEYGVAVPYLTYNNYGPYIGAMADSAKSLNDKISYYQGRIESQRTNELNAETAEAINANIKDSGELLAKYINAVADYQGAIASNYKDIIETKQRDLKSAISNFAALVTSVNDQKEAVSGAKIEFERAMDRYQTSEIIKAAINISLAFVTVGLTIATPANTIKALESLGETAQKIQKLVTVLSKIMDLEKTIEASVKNISAVTQTMNALEKVKLSMPSSQEWSEMSINFDACLATAPSEVAGAKAAFSAAFKILVLRAQAMLTAQAKIAQLNAEIAFNTAQEKINRDQKERLSKLTQGLNLGDTSKAPDLSEVDLLSLTGLLQSKLNQALSSLAQAMALQSSAVQFELLAEPVSITRFDLQSLQAVMASQQANIIHAKEAFNPPPFKVNDPILVAVKGVPIRSFTRGNSFEFQIQPSESGFQPYNMVRVQQVTVDIPAIRGSKSGKYRIDLTCKGNPFEDRNRSGDPLAFNTVARHFGPYGYNAADHKPLFGDQTGSIGNDITRITPFSTWEVRMPETGENKDIDFGPDSAVDIVLSFRIEALASPALLKRMRLLGKSVTAPAHGELMSVLSSARFRGGRMLAAAAAPVADASAVTLDDMLDQMNKAQGVLKGWDCVLNMLEQPVNRFLAQQYKEKYSSAKPMVVTVGFCQPISYGSSTILAYTRFSVELGPPLLEFQANNHNFVAVTQDIQEGYIQTGSKIAKGKGVLCPVPLDLDDPSIEWGDKTDIDVSKKPAIKGTVALTTVAGIVTPKLPDGKTGNPNKALSVILDFAAGSFVAKDLNVDTDNATLNLQLQNWFVTNPIQYLINTVVFEATTLASLTPSAFKLNVLTTNSKKNVLQVFIATTGRPQSNLTINVNEPIPDDYHNSLIINTKIMFEDIFVQSFNQGSTNLQVQSVNPGQDFTAWKAKVISGTVSGEAKFNNTSRSETRIAPGSNTITWPLEGLTFSPTKNLGVELKYQVKKKVDFQHRSYSCVSSGEGIPYCSWSGWSDHSVEVDVSLTGYYPLTVSQSHGKQDVQISSDPPSVTVTPPDLHPTGPCECNDNDLKIQVGEILKKQVPDKLKDSMAGIKFSPVSVFALYNLLFPADDFIVMGSAYVPGDLVIVGTFNKYVDA